MRSFLRRHPRREVLPRALTALTALGSLAALGAASLGVAACKNAPPPKPPSVCQAGPNADVPVVALSASATCPRAGASKDGRWDVAPLFPGEDGESLPASMQRLCVYTWSGCATPDAAALPLASLVDAADDPPVVQALAAAAKAPAEVVTAARRRLVRTTDALVPLVAGTGAAPVFVGLPDTLPGPSGKAGGAVQAAGDIPIEAESHGFDVAWVTRFLACPAGSLRPCLAQLRTDLALGRAGGRGTRSDLAASIVRLVRGWKKRDGRSAPLVLPIAAGWEPLAERAIPWRKQAGADATSEADGLPYPTTPNNGAGGASFTPGARAVLAALHYATCHGALVIAAAGNDPGYQEPPTGAMLPAAWEALPAPQASACKKWFGDDAVTRLIPPAATSYAPLVHAVGGVDDRDHPIVGTRAKSLPRLVAPASLVAAFPDDVADAGYAKMCAPGADVTTAFVCDRTTPRTGTSMAAAVTASIAAVVWAHHPTWSGHDVMTALYAGGVSLGEKADVSMTAPGKETIARVSMCGALLASCRGAPKGSCPDKLKCTKPPAYARGARPSPFVTVRPGVVPLAIDLAGAGPDVTLACPGCVFHTARFRTDGCELEGVVPATFFSGARMARLRQPELILYDAVGGRLGFVDEPGFRPTTWSSTEAGDQPVYADAATCNGTARVVLRWTACADDACTRTMPMSRELPVVE